MNYLKVVISYSNVKVQKIRVEIGNELNIHIDIGILIAKQGDTFTLKIIIKFKIAEQFKQLQMLFFLVFLI